MNDQERGYNIVKDGHDCFGSPIDAKAAVFQIKLHDRDLDLISDSSANKGRLQITDESGGEYDIVTAVLFGRLERQS